jgi:Ulp1 family protease
MSDSPIQENEYDCGVFTMMAASHLGNGVRLSYDQEDITNFYGPHIANDCLALFLKNLEVADEEDQSNESAIYKEDDRMLGKMVAKA